MGEKQDSLRNYMNLIERQTGKAVRPYRADGFVNVLTKYGTSKDSSEQYQYLMEPQIADRELESFYESNGLFAKVIDAPAEEAVKHGFELKDLNDKVTEDFYKEVLDELGWEDIAIQCIKWARLFGGAIGVMLIDDGRGLDEPLDFNNIRSIDDIRIYDRSIVMPDYSSIYTAWDNEYTRGSNLGKPQYYDVFSIYGTFRVHESRCLIFRNGILPERALNSVYRMWGTPEYLRLHRAIRDTEIAHGSAVKLLDRSVQAVYGMRGLSNELATQGGEERVLRRLETIDMARGLLNTVTIDADGEDYSFRQFSYTGVSEVIDTTCNYVSALTSIPQTILFGKSPAGMNATGHSDFESWYNYVERIQKRCLKNNLKYLLDIIFKAGYALGKIKEIPKVDIEFNPLWSLSEEDKISVDQQKAAIQSTKAQTAATYIDLQVLDPMEVRRALAKSDEFDIETMLDDYSEEEIEDFTPSGQDDMMGMFGGMQGGEPEGEENGPEEPKKELFAANKEEDDKIAEDEDDSEESGILTHNEVVSRLGEIFERRAPKNVFQRIIARIRDRYARRRVDYLSKNDIIRFDKLVKWVTMNGVHVPIDENGQMLAKAKGRNILGHKAFVSKKVLDDHWYGYGKTYKGVHYDHKSEFPGMTIEEYEKRAVELAETPVGGDVVGYVDDRNRIVRFNRKTGEYVKACPNNGIITFFKPKYPRDGGVYRLSEAKLYYQENKKEDMKNGGIC